MVIFSLEILKKHLAPPSPNVLIATDAIPAINKITIEYESHFNDM